MFHFATPNLETAQDVCSFLNRHTGTPRILFQHSLMSRFQGGLDKAVDILLSAEECEQRASLLNGRCYHTSWDMRYNDQFIRPVKVVQQLGFDRLGNVKPPGVMLALDMLDRLPDT